MTGLPSTIFVGVSGASGAVYAQRLLQQLSFRGCRLALCLSDPGLQVVCHELGITASERDEATRVFLKTSHANATVYHPDDLGAAVSSGTAAPDAVVVCPCSLSSAAAIALGTTSTLIHRVGMVALKERRPLVLVPREMPLSSIHLRRLLEASEAGAYVVPAMPGFYGRPQTLQDVVDSVVGKVLTVLGFEHTLYPAWGGEDA